MSTYAIGDIQGCYDELLALLEKVEFNPQQDRLCFVGDLVNRGPNSLEVLRFVYDHQHCCTMVLGNHDLHLLAVYYGARQLSSSDTLKAVLNAQDVEVLMNYLRAQPLLYNENNFVVVHAGIAPQWSLEKAKALANEVESKLQGNEIKALLENMYSNEPALFDDALTGHARYRCILNYFTRMRFCDALGRLNLYTKGEVMDHPDGFFPWFNAPNRQCAEKCILFGHWAALRGKTDNKNAIALDTGCVWGGALTAFRLDDQRYFSVDALT